MTARADDRARLEFESTARKTFSSITAEHGFDELGADEFTVHYRGPSGWFTVMHDPLSYELDIAFAPVGNDAVERPFGMVDFIRVIDSDRANGYRNFAATSLKGVQRGLEQLAVDTRLYAEAALSGKISFLMRVAKAREQAIREFGDSIQHHKDQRLAEDAIRRKDWQRIIELYEPREDRLDNVEKKRLEIARKHVSYG